MVNSAKESDTSRETPASRRGRSMRLIIGDYEIEPATRKIFRLDGTPIHLSNRPFQVLHYLISHRDRLVTRADLLNRFWDGREVYDGNLTRCISSIRKALNDQGDTSRYIETRWAEGYRYIGSVQEVPARTSRDVDADNTDPLVHRPRRAPDIPPAEPTLSSQPPAASVAKPSIAARVGRKPLLFAVAVLVVSTLLTAPYVYKAAIAPAAKPSVAVMPLANLSGDASNEYFSDGLTDSLISTLSGIDGLRVISRTSVFELTDQPISPQEIGRRLDVAYLFEGSVRGSRDTTRVDLRLVRTKDGEVIWASGTQDFSGDNLFASQDAIARDAARELRERLELADADATRDLHSTQNLEAYENYLKGRYLWNRRDAESLRQAISHFQRAVRIDPTYARAHAGLADALVLSPFYGIARSHDAFPQARAAALEALRLDESLAEAHATLAVIKEQYDYDWAGAEAEFRRALTLSPNYATARQWYSEYLFYRGRWDESIAEIRRAQELDPLSPVISALAGSPYLWKRDYAKAREAYARTVAQHPDFSLGRYMLGRAFQGLREYDEAIELYREALPSLGMNTIAGPLINTYALAGRTDEARELFREFTQSAAPSPISSYKLAIAHAAIGEREQALEWLEKSYADRDDRLIMLAIDPDLDSLRHDPRFQSLLKRVGLDGVGR